MVPLPSRVNEMKKLEYLVLVLRPCPVSAESAPSDWVRVRVWVVAYMTLMLLHLHKTSISAFTIISTITKVTDFGGLCEMSKNRLRRTFELYKLTKKEDEGISDLTFCRSDEICRGGKWGGGLVWYQVLSKSPCRFGCSSLSKLTVQAQNSVFKPPHVFFRVERRRCPR